MFRAAGEDVSEEDELVVPCGFWKSFLTSKFTFEDVGSEGAGVATVDREAVEPVVDDTVVEEAPEVTTDDLDDIDALPLT